MANQETGYSPCNYSFIEVDMMIYIPEKVIFTEAAMPTGISLERVDKSLCVSKLKSIPVLLTFQL